MQGRLKTPESALQYSFSEACLTAAVDSNLYLNIICCYLGNTIGTGAST
jgi:hypothetical protein